MIKQITKVRGMRARVLEFKERADRMRMATPENAENRMDLVLLGNLQMLEWLLEEGQITTTDETTEWDKQFTDWFDEQKEEQHG